MSQEAVDVSEIRLALAVHVENPEVVNLFRWQTVFPGVGRWEDEHRHFLLAGDPAGHPECDGEHVRGEPLGFKHSGSPAWRLGQEKVRGLSLSSDLRREFAIGKGLQPLGFPHAQPEPDVFQIHQPPLEEYLRTRHRRSGLNPPPPPPPPFFFFFPPSPVVKGVSSPVADGPNNLSGSDFVRFSVPSNNRTQPWPLQRGNCSSGPF